MVDSSTGFLSYSRVEGMEVVEIYEVAKSANALSHFIDGSQN